MLRKCLFFLLAFCSLFSGERVYMPIVSPPGIDVYDVATNTLVKTISLDTAPSNQDAIAIAQTTLTGYVTSTDGSVVYVFDLITNDVTGSIAIPNGPVGIGITPDETTAYVTAIDNDSGEAVVYPITLASEAVGSAITGFPEANPSYLDVRPNGVTAYALGDDLGNAIITPITVSNNTAGAQISIAAINGGNQISMAVDADGSFAYVGSNFGSLVVAIDLDNTPSQTSISVSSGVTISLAASPDGSFVYAGGTDGSIDRISGTTTPATALLTITGSARALAVSTDSATLFAANTSIYPIDLSGPTAGSGVTLSGTAVSMAIGSPPDVVGGIVTAIANQTTFFTQKNIYNTLTWTDPNSREALRYEVYRNAELTDLAATVLADAEKVFIDQNLRKKTEYSYYVQTVYSNGDTNLLGSSSVFTP